MADVFLQTLSTPAVLAAQRQYYGRSSSLGSPDGTDRLTPDEQAFIETRDSFYMATVTENGWPYVQHRGGSAWIPTGAASRSDWFCGLPRESADAVHRESGRE